MDEPGGSNKLEKAESSKNRSDRMLPMANVGRIMKQGVPPHAKISKEAKEMMQECASEFISFITSEASHICKKENRKTIHGEDICSTLDVLGFKFQACAMQKYLERYRAAEGREKSASQSMDLDHPPVLAPPPNTDPHALVSPPDTNPYTLIPRPDTDPYARPSTPDTNPYALLPPPNTDPYTLPPPPTTDPYSLLSPLRTNPYMLIPPPDVDPFLDLPPITDPFPLLPQYTDAFLALPPNTEPLLVPPPETDPFQVQPPDTDHPSEDQAEPRIPPFDQW